jgi:hypothetical protein
LKDKQERFMSPDYCREVIELIRMTIQIFELVVLTILMGKNCQFWFQFLWTQLE